MEWLADNWLWVAGGVLILILIYVFTRPKRKKQLTPAEQEKVVAFLVAKLTQALEEVVDDTVGRHYTRQDRQRIAMGMIAVMAADEITLEQMASNSALFAEVMMKSIATLTAMGHISTR